jgi:hypothetical protein
MYTTVRAIVTQKLKVQTLIETLDLELVSIEYKIQTNYC